jgi:hypothetical protein
MAQLLTLFARVHLKTGNEKFFRCGIEFSREWKKLTDVDAATAKRLREEQMLDVVDEQPADYVDPEAKEKAEAEAKANSAAIAPTDPAERAAAIKQAIGKLDAADATLWTGTGMPKVPAIAAVTGWEVAQQERDAVWAEINKA